jgi:6-phosphogluconolactonase (cycloisomerase 2 family)
MRHNPCSFRLSLVLASFTGVAALGCTANMNDSDAQEQRALDAVHSQAPSGVYTMTNHPDANAIIAYVRDANGDLTADGIYPTGGKGTGGGLGDQGALVYDAAKARFFAVNAGDNSISMMALESNGKLTLQSHVASGGVKPISVTFSGNLVYVANFGDDTNPANVTGFKVSHGALEPVANSTRSLSADHPQPAQLQFTAEGDVLVVTEKMTNKIDTFTLDGVGLSDVMVHDSAGMTPFGFAFDANDTLIVSEAFGGMPGATSSYKLTDDGDVSVVSASVASGQGAPCWVAIRGNHAYVTNTKSKSVTSYKVSKKGKLTLDDASGVAGTTGDNPIDEAVTPEGDFLYVLNGLNDAPTPSHSISIFAIDNDGRLTKKSDFMGFPSKGVGLVVR